MDCATAYGGDKTLNVMLNLFVLIMVVADC